jgi:hypothetical protein
MGSSADFVTPACDELVFGEIDVRVQPAEVGWIRSVLFQIDGVDFDTDLLPPYETLLDTRALADGVHELVAVVEYEHDRPAPVRLRTRVVVDNAGAADRPLQPLNNDGG